MLNQILQQLPALIGVVVGAGGSFLVSSVNQRTQWRRAQSTRWDDRRLQAYVDYSNAVKKMIHLAVRMSAHRGLTSSLPPLHPDSGLVQFAEADSERTEKWETVLLLGDPDTVAAARNWHTRVWRLEGFATGEQHDRVQWEAALRSAAIGRLEFYSAARHDLGVGGVLPPGQMFADWKAGEANASVQISSTQEQR